LGDGTLAVTVFQTRRLEVFMAARHSCNGCFHTLLVHLMLASSFLVPVQAQQISAVVSAASDQPVISPNSLATIFGANLAPAAASAQVGASGALPAALGGTTVSIGGKSAPLLYVSPQQINFLVPADTPLGQANVSVQTSTSSSAVTGSVHYSMPSSIAWGRTERRDLFARAISNAHSTESDCG
jgi:hypothetical protein